MILNETVAAIADAIREKTGKSELIAPVDFAEEINGITAGGGDGESNITYYRYDRDNAMAVWGDASSEYTLILYANMVGGLDITGISPSGKLTAFSEALYSVHQNNERMPLSYYATKPNTIMGKHNPLLAEQVTNMHDFIRLIAKEMMQWSEEQINAAVALFTEISEEEFFVAITA